MAWPMKLPAMHPTVHGPYSNLTLKTPRLISISDSDSSSLIWVQDSIEVVIT